MRFGLEGQEFEGHRANLIIVGMIRSLLGSRNERLRNFHIQKSDKG